MSQRQPDKGLEILHELKAGNDKAPVSFDTAEPLEVRRAQTEVFIPKELVPDLRSMGRNRSGFATEIGTSDAEKIKQAIEAAQSKPLDQQQQQQKVKKSASLIKRRQQPVVHTIAGYRVNHPLPDDSNIGWTAFSRLINPGGSLNIPATEINKADILTNTVFEHLVAPPFHENWQDYGIIFGIGIGFWMIVKLGGGITWFILGLLFIASYYKITYQRFHARTTDDIKRGMAHIKLESSEFEKVEWLNNFVQKFWLIFEPLLSDYVIENIDTYLVDYLPVFLDSVRLTTFTLGSKPFRINRVKSFTDTNPDTVCMDWTVSFAPDDTYGMTKAQVDSQVSPKVVLNIRLGKGFVGTALPVLVEDMSFSGRMRIKIQFLSRTPHIKIVEACFMEKPIFNYVLKPLGGETFGFDINNIPGLQSFVRDQAHAILGPMMYYPNVISYDIEKFFSGELDINQANGVLAITVHSCSHINASDVTLNPFIRFYLNKAQELEKTSICENTRTPHWNETKFLLLNNLDSILTMELRTSNHTKRAGKRIARSNFDLKDLKEEEDNELDNLVLPMQRHGKRITDLKADMKYFPVSKPIKNPDGTFIEAAPSNSGVLRVTIHECKNLGSSKVNPFASIKINSVDRFETPTFKRTANPKFERSYEILVLDRTEVYIRVSITDRINFSGDTSLGAWSSYLVDVMRDQEEKEYWWTLKKKGQDTAARLKFSVQWKPVVMSGLAKMGGVSLYLKPVGVVRLSIWSAKGLPSSRVGSNKQDRYVRVKSGKQIRAKTEVTDNNENPEWGEFHYIPVHSVTENLLLEVMDWSAKSEDASLGSTVLHMKDLISQHKDEATGALWYEASVEKYDQDAPLFSDKSQKGSIQYTAEFYPTMALANRPDEDEDEEKEGVEPTKVVDTENVVDSNKKEHSSKDARLTTPQAGSDESSHATTPVLRKLEYDPIPKFDLHSLPIRYTPDDLLDLSSYTAGVLTVKIHEIKASTVYECYCQLMIDSLNAQHKTNILKGRLLTFNEISDAFIKDAGFSRVAIEVKPVHKTDKDDDLLAYWYDSSERIIKHLQQRARMARKEDMDISQMLLFSEEDEGEWYNMINPVGGPAQIRLSFGYTPLLSYKVNPDESLENQGNLTVTLLCAKNLKAADKSGTSDPYVKFTVNGDVVHKSSVMKKNCNPKWKDEKFEVAIISRVTASFRIEVFDWNQISGDVPLGSGGITLRGDMVESFLAHDWDILLDGMEGVTGSVRVRLKWEPQLLSSRRKRTHTTFMGTTATHKMTTTKMGTTAFNWSQPLKNTTTITDKPVSTTKSIQSKLSNILESTSSSKAAIPSTNPSFPQTNQLQQQQQQSKEIESIHSSTVPPNKHDFVVKITPGTATVTVLGARELRGDLDKLHPQVIVYLGKDLVLKTKKMKKTSSPIWNESFSQHLNGEEIDIEFVIKDSHTFHSNNIGICQYSLWDLIRPPIVNSLDKWLPLEPEGNGEIHVKIDYQ